MREGAYDYICKPFDNDELKLLVQKALEKRALVGENRALRELARAGAGVIWIGASAAMQRGLDAGREGGAHALHRADHGRERHRQGAGRARDPPEERARRAARSSRSTARALAEGVLESELFGHVKGAFTGATHGPAGPPRRRRATGTVFLDEIGEIPPVDAGEAAARAAGAAGEAGGQRAARCRSTCAIVAATNSDSRPR